MINFDKAEKIIKELDSLNRERQIKNIIQLLLEIEAFKRELKLMSNGVNAIEKEKLS